uniref:Putative secreted protein n=1 Tax=Anopheles darlingi TaxID=43151 RepID=A0A2M4DFW7_ANODA
MVVVVLLLMLINNVSRPFMVGRYGRKMKKNASFIINVHSCMFQCHTRRTLGEPSQKILPPNTLPEGDRGIYNLPSPAARGGTPFKVPNQPMERAHCLSHYSPFEGPSTLEDRKIHSNANPRPILARSIVILPPTPRERQSRFAVRGLIHTHTLVA